jgi:hypothetical protein
MKLAKLERDQCRGCPLGRVPCPIHAALKARNGTWADIKAVARHILDPLLTDRDTCATGELLASVEVFGEARG